MACFSTNVSEPSPVPSGAAATELMHYGARLDAPADTLCDLSAAEWGQFSPEPGHLNPKIGAFVYNK